MRRLVLCLALACVLGSGCASTGTTDGAAPEPRSGASSSRSSEKDGPSSALAPDFTVTTFSGETFSLAEQRGTPVVLNFWESW